MTSLCSGWGDRNREAGRSENWPRGEYIHKVPHSVRTGTLPLSTSFTWAVCIYNFHLHICNSRQSQNVMALQFHQGQWSGAGTEASLGAEWNRDSQEDSGAGWSRDTSMVWTGSWAMAAEAQPGLSLNKETHVRVTGDPDRSVLGCDDPSLYLLIYPSPLSIWASKQSRESRFNSQV